MIMDERIFKVALAIALGEFDPGNSHRQADEPAVRLTPEEMSEAIMAAAALNCHGCGA